MSNWKKVGEAKHRAKEYDIFSYYDNEAGAPAYQVHPAGKEPKNGGGYLNVKSLCERKGLTITYLNEE